MKSLIQVVVVAAALAAPVAVFAQSNAPLTRAQVRAELIQLEKAGYHPGDGDNTTYPADIQAAEAKVAAQNNAVGGVVDGSSQSGRATDTAVSTYSPRIYTAH
ncbi:DUF4148 domain-containing protein [Paraburkholderia sp. BL9I2N2]|uniref:DUF4148 domain-containing protein n=1 Tax=Paraburkholderia sp. BL9I2N2 TaxID=1938809 RepID=UPI00104A3096|nr:DUF4148 domain-containing protein [Paraburkholderia sp. BL9I2N2]TCK84018.1 uncharacterized protein DUF4148 [Paraburkholderia sp. BL9I2N2]